MYHYYMPNSHVWLSIIILDSVFVDIFICSLYAYMSVYTCIWRPEINFEFLSLLITLHLISCDRVCHWTWSSLLQRGCTPVWSRGPPVLLVQLRIADLDCHYSETHVIACEASTFPSNPLIHPPYQVLCFISSLLMTILWRKLFLKMQKRLPWDEYSRKVHFLTNQSLFWNPEDYSQLDR